MFSNITQHIKARHIGLLALCGLAYVYLSLFRYDNFGIEEGAARALLINWTIVHQIASPVGLFGTPDLRAFLFVPLDLHWAGSLIAAKVFTMLILFATALMLYRWAEREYGAEAAMIATGLLVVAPISLMQSDSIGGGIYLLAAFAVIRWLDEQFRESRHTVPSFLFLQGLMVAFAISIHPIGLAATLVLGWQWYRESDQPREKRRNMLIMLGIATVIILVIRWGWPGLADTQGNMLHTLGNALLGPDLIHNVKTWGIGLIIADVLLLAIAFHLYRRNRDTLSLMLMTGALLGMAHADEVWAMVAFAAMLYLATPLIIQLNQRYGWQDIVGKRGIVLILFVLVTTMAMTTDREYRQIREQHLLSDTDAVIAVLAHEAENTQRPFLAASQWPGRTLLVTRRDVLPLPPANGDAQAFRKRIGNLTHMAFDPNRPENHELARQAASLSHYLQTIALLPGGVVLKARTGKGSPQKNPIPHHLPG